MKRIEKIRAMSAEELAKVLANTSLMDLACCAAVAANNDTCPVRQDEDLNGITEATCEQCMCSWLEGEGDL